ncbi:uncharacterized protein LOC133909446 [Phragmites australis]|uniref:uncharacterized protein LOC133909446 n=1 Tax=Phragmites australis TaxID=29695 RepID=UPI002D791276|nr:uncharacterized protein LOC133909446 [Phragmites australis]
MQKKPRKLKKRKVNYKRSPKEVKNPAEIEQPNQYASLDNENKHETNAEKVKEDNEGITGISNSDEGRKKEQKIKNPAKIEQPNQYASLDNENKHETNAEEVKEDNEGITGISNSDEGRKKEQKIKIPAEIEHRNQYASLDNKNKHETNTEEVKKDNEDITGISNSYEGYNSRTAVKRKERNIGTEKNNEEDILPVHKTEHPIVYRSQRNRRAPIKYMY